MLVVTASVLLGLVMAARVVPAAHRRAAVRLHEQLALIGLAAIAAHGLLLAADPWLRAGVRGMLVPFAIHYRPLWVALGIVGGYLAAILGLSFYARRRIGARTWRRLHRLTVAVYVLALGHTLGAGTDASIPLVRAVVLASALPVLALFALRVKRARALSAASLHARAPSPRDPTSPRAAGGQAPADGSQQASAPARLAPGLSRAGY
jgi:sulfoxide reductase heme-binding subunit YedZ